MLDKVIVVVQYVCTYLSLYYLLPMSKLMIHFSLLVQHHFCLSLAIYQLSIQTDSQIGCNDLLLTWSMNRLLKR